MEDNCHQAIFLFSSVQNLSWKKKGAEDIFPNIKLHRKIFNLEISVVKVDPI